MKKVWDFVKEEEGTETVEWAIMIGIIAVGAIGLIISIGGWVSTKFQALATALGVGGGS